MQNKLFKKGLVIGIIILLIAVSVLPSTGDVINKNIKLEGQLVVEETSASITNGDDVDWWPMFHHDLNNTGYSSSPTAPETSHLLWTYLTGAGGVEDSAAIVDDRLYIGADDEWFYCLNANNGAKIWKTSLPGGTGGSSPCVVDGRIYMSSTYDYVYCWDADTGEEIWKFYKGYGCSRSPAASDDKVYFPYNSNNSYPQMLCLDADGGTKIWNISLTEGSISHATYYNGNVYFSDYYSKIYCLDGETGETIWENTTGGRNGAPAIYDGKVIASANGIRCYDAETGEQYWHYQGSWSYCSPAVGYNKIYYVSSDGEIICLDADDGDEVWVYDIGSSYEHAVCSPAVADGKAYFGIWSNGYLYCLNASNGEFIWDYKVANAGWLFSSPSIANGVVYMGGSLTRKIYAFGGYETPPDDPYKPFGPIQGLINIKYTYFTWGLDPEADKVQFRFDWDANGSHDYSEWSDFVSGSKKVYMKHAWNSSGTFVVKAQARDEHYALSNWSEGLTVVISENNPPDAPSIDGPSSGKPGITHVYTLSTVDPEDHDVFYFVDWGDGTHSSWLGPYVSGKEITASHVWEEPGIYIIKAKARDVFYNESDWSEFVVTMPRDKALTGNMLLQRLLERFPLLQRLYNVWRLNLE